MRYVGLIRAHNPFLNLSVSLVHNKTQHETLVIRRFHLKIPSEGCIAGVTPGNSLEGSPLVVSLVTDVAAKAADAPQTLRQQT